MGKLIHFPKFFRWYDYAFLGGIFVYLFFLSMEMHLFYDEAYNLQVPLTLLKDGKYDTIYHVRSFDSLTTITTGPTVIIPIFWVFKLMGVGVVRARLVNYLFVIGLIALLWDQFVKKYNRIIGIALLLILFSIPQFGMMLSVLGEIPAIFFIFFGVVIWERELPRSQYVGILVMGIAVLTKLYFLLVLLPLLAFITIRTFQTKKKVKEYFSETLIAAFLFLLPWVLGELIKFIALGFGMYRAYLAELIEFASSQQIDFGNLLTTQIAYTPFDKFEAFSKGLFPGFPVWIAMILLTGIIITSVPRINQDIREGQVVYSLSFLIFVTYLIWFMFLDSAAWWRHISPFSILFLYVLGDFIYRLVNSFERPLPKYLSVLGLCMMFGFLIFPFVIDQYKYTQSFSERLIAQREFADEVNTYLDKGYKIGVHGWWQAPEIAFLTGGAKFAQFRCEDEHHGKYLVIYTELEEALAPSEAAALRDCLGEQVFENSDRTLFLYEPIQ